MARVSPLIFMMFAKHLLSTFSVQYFPQLNLFLTTKTFSLFKSEIIFSEPLNGTMVILSDAWCFVTGLTLNQELI